MIYQPRNIQPSYKSIDGLNNNNFTMEINTNISVIAYKLKILTSQNVDFFNGEKIILETPVYNGEQLVVDVPSSIGLINGNDYKWRLRLYQQNADMLITYGNIPSTSTVTNIYIQPNINVKIDMYIKIGSEIKQITDYNLETGLITLTDALSLIPSVGTTYQILSDFIETVPDNIIYVRKTPVVSITNMPTILDKKYYEFIGSYVQDDNVPLVYFTWNLYLINNNIKELIYTNDKTSSANIKFSYDGFKTDQSYQIELFVETEYGIIASSGLQSFSVSYTSLEYLQQPNAKLIKDKNAIQIDWITPTSFAPSTINLNAISGIVQPGDITLNTLYLEKNQEIYPGMSFNIENYTNNTIVSYNSYTGFTKVTPDFNVSISAEMPYQITTTTLNNFEGIQIEKDTPYLKTNSAFTGQHALSYSNPNSVIANYPDLYRITMQFRPSYNFFYGVSGVYNDMIKISDITTTDSLGAGNISIFAHKYKIVAIKPVLIDNTVDISSIIIAPEGEENNIHHIFLEKDIDISTQQYLTFVDQDYTEKISTYDEVTKMATFDKALPFIPEVGDNYYINETLSTDFYSNVNNVFTLQNTNIVNPVNDYIWNDSAIWPSEEIENSYYWVEGGTEVERIADYWWKLELTNDNIKIEKGVY